MHLDVVNSENKKVDSVDIRDDVFGGWINADLMWESVVHANAAERRGTHMRIQKSMGQLDSPDKVRTVRRDLARVKTVLRQKRAQ